METEKALTLEEQIKSLQEQIDFLKSVCSKEACSHLS